MTHNEMIERKIFLKRQLIQIKKEEIQDIERKIDDLKNELRENKNGHSLRSTGLREKFSCHSIAEG
jgi:hypothetical protein